MKSPPFHPQSNGQAERFVDTFKRNFEKMKGRLSPAEALQKFLQTYRRTPCSSTPEGKSPAEVFLGREIRTRLSLLKPNVTTNDSIRNHTMEEQYNRHRSSTEGVQRWATWYGAIDYSFIRKPKQAQGRVLKRYGNRLYDVLIDGQIWKRHANQPFERWQDFVITRTRTLIYNAANTLIMRRKAEQILGCNIQTYLEHVLAFFQCKPFIRDPLTRSKTS
ncbi:hypothetical protein OSTOST_06063, partial [Ostertagia ostertagi]